MADEEQNGAGAAAAGEQEVPAQQFALQRVYLKDLSYESPAAPGVFRKEWKPSINVDLRTSSNAMEGGNYEVVLTLTITAKLEDETAFLVEVQQAGVFFIQGIEGEELRRIVSIFCPNMLFPYAREAVDNIVTKGTFPALMMAQVNFEALYLQAQQNAQAAAKADSAAATDEAAS